MKVGLGETLDRYSAKGLLKFSIVNALDKKF